MTSTPLKERSAEFADQSAGPTKGSSIAEEGFKTGTEMEVSRELFSQEAKVILNTTPELNQEQGQEGYKSESNISTPSISKSNLSVDDMMVSQLSLDSERLGHLHEQRQRRVNATSFIASTGNSVNDLSLFAELSSEEPNIMMEMESASCFSSVGKEVEGLIKENEELLGSK